MAPNELDQLLAHPPLVHRDGTGEVTSWQLPDDVLRYMAEAVRPGDATLETGEGLSTIVMAMSGARHTCVSPNVEALSLIQEYCSSNGISFDGVSVLQGMSQEVLPAAELPPLDLVLIDGCHGFPSPMIDWFYTAQVLKPGGRMVIDDMQLASCRLVADFLRTEPGWETDFEYQGHTEAFVKTSDRPPGLEWALQPYDTTNSWSHQRAHRAYLARHAGGMLRRGEILTLTQKAWRMATARVLQRG